MNNFERGKNPKEAMGVGLSKRKITPENIIIHFSINSEIESARQNLEIFNFGDFLRMWESGIINSEKLIKILNLNQFWKRIDQLRLEKVVIKIREFDQFDLAGNFIEYRIGEGETAVISFENKIYFIPVKNHSRFFST